MHSFVKLKMKSTTAIGVLRSIKQVTQEDSRYHRRDFNAREERRRSIGMYHFAIPRQFSLLKMRTNDFGKYRVERDLHGNPEVGLNRKHIAL